MDVRAPLVRGVPATGLDLAEAARGSRASDAIAITRVLCILGVIYVHAWTGLGGAEHAALASSGQGILRWVLIELFGRSAVPLLGMISGWLVAGSTRTRSYRTFVSGKARTILLPMLLWNALSILLVSGAAYFGTLQAPIPTSVWWLVNELFSLATPNDINVQAPFLRDLFLCMAAAPLLLRLPDKALAAIAIAVAVWVVAGWSLPILLRPQILLFFIAGMLVRRRDLAGPVAHLPMMAAVLPFALILPFKIWLSVWGTDIIVHHAHVVKMIDILMRFAAALLVWRLAWALAASAAARPLKRIEPYAFLIFCSHLIMIWLAGPLLGQLTGPLGSPAYPLFLLLQPVLVAAAAIPLGHMLLACSPAAADLLSGGRLKAGKPAPLNWQPA